MSEFFSAGGFGMYPTLLFGFFLVACSILFLFRPEPRYLASLVGLGATTFCAGLLGTCSGVINTLCYMETSEGEPRPSQAARERLRLAVARELRARAPARSWRWWERPLALGGALAVLAGAILVTYSVSIREGVAPRSLTQLESGTVSPVSPE